MKLNLLKFVYRGVLTGMPLFTYNPVTKLPFHSPFTIKPASTYINFKLSEYQSNSIQKYINNYNNDLILTPVKIIKGEVPKYYLSVNIYNCSSPLFMNKNAQVTRCEINTYVKDKKNNKVGTLILDYASNGLSMDPINIFKEKSNVKFELYDDYPFSLPKIYCYHEDEKMKLSFDMVKDTDNKISIDDELFTHSDLIYYKNGIYDKLYYDSSLTESNIQHPRKFDNYWFRYNNLTFPYYDSVFYFKDEIDFVGSMWYNLYDISKS